MKPRRRYRSVVCVAAAAVAAVAAIAVRGELWLDGLLYDAALAVRAVAAGPASGDEPVAVVAIDSRSLDSPELRAVPRVLMAPQWARLIDAAVAAEAAAIGFDLLFAWSAAGFLPDHDRPLLERLGRHRDRVVLARTASTPPAAPFFFASGAGADANALGFVEVAPDSDGVHRRVRARAASADSEQLTFAAAVAARAGLGPMPDQVRLAPRRSLTAIPTYSLIDVLRCAEAAPETIAERFRGRILLVGTILADEDRKRAPDRFLPPPPPAAAPADGDCTLDRRTAGRDGGTVPGVYLHAEALTALAEGRVVAAPPPPLIAGAAAAAAAGGAFAGLSLAPLAAAAAVAGIALLLFAGETVLLDRLLWLPVGLPIIAAGVAVAAAYAVRYLVEDRRRRRIQHAFGHYLAPAIVDRLLDAEAPPRLGGETSEVSVMFADLSGFTALSGRVAPERLMAMTNRYLGHIVEAVEDSGGYVDKFIGDAVMAVWGAPVADPDHAADAVAAALAAVERVTQAQAADAARGEAGFAVKIGINSGPATVGNVGWRQRFNYTAIGETVNLAARLEGVPGDYGCRIVVGPKTAAAAGRRFRFCELDAIRVKGHDAALAVHEPIVDGERATAVHQRYLEDYHAALADYRAGRFAAAEQRWRRLDYRSIGGAGGGPPAVMAERAARLAAMPPPMPWDGVWVREGK